jgi:hypothetical protein
MPLLIRTEIERLFKEGRIPFLVCTSTLIEGVNLPCKSIFVRGPHKGRGKPMNETDFWNLAGRAGRLGKEFQGNVICVDPRAKNVWKSLPPTRRGTYPIKPAAESVFENFGHFDAYITAGTPIDVSAVHPEYDQLVTYLISHFTVSRGLTGAPACAVLSVAQRTQLETSIQGLLQSVTVPTEIIVRNPGISPHAMERLLKLFQGSAQVIDQLIPAYPESNDAVDVFNKIFGLINLHVAPVFSSQGRTLSLAILVVDWMKGHPLALIIKSRIKYFEKNNREYVLAQTIRSVMDDVEQVARFIAPRYLSCYIDLLRYYLEQNEQGEIANQLPDVNLWLEFGASQQTQLSLMGLGLSRTTAIAVSELITDHDLSEAAALQRLRDLNIESLGLPLAIQREVSALTAAVLTTRSAE